MTLRFAPAALVALLCAPAWGADYTISVSLDTSPQHVRNVWLKEFATKLEEASGGRLALEIFEAAAKYKDVEAASAVAQGAIDMAIPQYQLISRFVPEADLEQLPMFYGASHDAVYGIVDGPLGYELHGRIEAALQIKVLGRPIDLGFGTVFSTDIDLTSPDDLAGLKVRVPGGPSTIKRYDVMGAAPVQIAWPDVPQALQTGTISALWSTQESVASAKLWDAGVRHAMEDRQAIVQYLPLMSLSAWNDLPAELQTALTDTWDSMVDGQREMALDRQIAARALNVENGIETVDPDPASLAAMRDKLLAAQPDLVAELGMDADFIGRVQAELTK